MFAYCLCNPVNGSDRNGKWYIADGLTWLWNNAVKPAAKWVSNEILKPTAKAIKSGAKKVVDATLKPLILAMRDTLSQADGTFACGINAVGSWPGIWSVNYQYGLAVDFKGNVAIQSTFVGGVTTGTPSGSIGLYATVTNAPTVNDLAGPGYQIGGSVNVISPSGLGVSGGGELNIIDATSTRGKYYYGATGLLGITAWPGGETHAEWGETTNVSTFNIYDTMADCYHWMFD